MTDETDTGGVAADRLRSFVERVEHLEEEKREVADQIKEVLAEAKGEGYDVKAMRQVLKLRAMRPHERAEREELLALYRSALGME